MVEGPQVKLCAEWLHRLLGGYHPRVESPSPALREVVRPLDGRRVVRAFAKGKHLFVEFDDGRCLWNHMVEHGRWYRLAPDAPLPEDTWVVFRVEGATIVNRSGERMGVLDEHEVRARLDSIGVDVMEAPYPSARVVEAIRSSDEPVGEVLVDQSRIAGVGDVARSEALFLAGIDPRLPGRELEARDAERLALAIHRVTLECYHAGGRWVYRVWRRAGRYCAECGSEILHIAQGTPPRDTFLCPHCQRSRFGERAPADVRPLARAVTREGLPCGRFAVGCAVWSFPGWVGSFYPPDASAREFLELYGQRLTAVEGNTSFYAIPPSETVARWAERLPHGFRFCPKLYREITHRGQLDHEAGLARKFVDHVLLLGDRLGPVFAQLPASYGPDRLSDLTAFVTAWPHAEVPLAIEVRHAGWYEKEAAERLAELLRDHSTGTVVLDSRPIHEGGDDVRIAPGRRKPLLPVNPRATSGECIVRFVGHPDRERNGRYLEEWAGTVTRWLEEGRDVTFFAHCPREEESPFVARDFQRLLEARNAPVPPLPWDGQPTPAAQRDLFEG